MSVVPLGINRFFEAWSTAQHAANGQRVAFFGRLSEYKGLNILYEALPQVAARVPGLEVDVAGKPVPGYQLPPPPELPNGGHLRVSPEYLHNDRLTTLVQQASLIVCPYIDATQSGVIMTSYALGRPVIASAVGGLLRVRARGRRPACSFPRATPPRWRTRLPVPSSEDGLLAHLHAGVAALEGGDLEWASIGTSVLGIYAGINELVGRAEARP